MDLEEFLAEVRSFAENEYLTALFKGASLTVEEKDALAEKLSGYTGLKKEDILRHNCRIKSEEFCSGLFADDVLMVGRVDSRFTGPVTSGSLEDGDSDPSTSALDSTIICFWMMNTRLRSTSAITRRGTCSI